ncbi:MAG: ABC transporter ATP-binding protein [Candidatus Falkowbacteria bacterium]
MGKNNKIIEKTEKETISWKIFGRELWKLLQPFRKLFYATSAIILVSAILDLGMPYILKLLIDGLNGFDLDNLWVLIKLIILYLATSQVRSLLDYFSDRRILRLLVDVEYHLGVKAQAKLVSLDLGYHERENTGAKIVKIERGVDKISQFLNNIFWEVAPTVIQLFLTLIALFWSDWRIGLSFLVFAPMYLATTYFANKKMYPVRKAIYKDYEVASGKMGQAIININAVQSFVQEKRELSEFEKIKVKVRENEDKQFGWMMKVSLGRSVIVDVGRAVVLFLGVYFVYKGVLSVGTLIFAFTLSEKAYISLYRLSRFYDRMEEGREGVNRLLKLFNSETSIINKKNGYKPKDIKGEIKFEHTSFYYGDNKKPAIIDLNFKITPGCVIALVGPSGGGKTTVARLIYRHYDPQKGRVLLDDKDLRDYDVQSFRKFLAIVPQEVEIFDLSVRENIAYAKPKASFQEIQAAARIANAEEFITKLDKGYETMVGERGIRLSGGQRQRIGIARAILANPRILIFDEATSNLDSQSEVLIQDAMEKISRGRTMIIIAHRLSTIKKVDKIIVLENGRVAEEGSHSELAHVTGGLYAKLLKLQELGEVD